MRIFFQRSFMTKIVATAAEACRHLRCGWMCDPSGYAFPLRAVMAPQPQNVAMSGIGSKMICVKQFCYEHGKHLQKQRSVTTEKVIPENISWKRNKKGQGIARTRRWQDHIASRGLSTGFLQEILVMSEFCPYYQELPSKLDFLYFIS